MSLHILYSTLSHPLLAAIAFIISRVSFLLAMVLPWKILAVASGMGSAYFDVLNFYDEYSTKQQVVYLGATVVAFFVLHIVLDLLFDFLVGQGATKAIEKSNKVGVFNNYRSFAKRIYKYYVTLFSAGLYVLIAVFLLFFIYTSLIFNLMVYLLLSGLLIYLFFKLSHKKIEDVSDWLSIFYKAWWHTGFVMALIWAITDYWQGTMPTLLVTFFSLLLYRQLLVMITTVANNSNQIYKNRVRAGQVFSLLPNKEHQAKVELSVKFEQMFSQLEQQNWLSALCEEYCSKLKNINTEKACHLVDGGNVAYITVLPKENEDKNRDGLLIKLYNKNRDALAEQEALLLNADITSFPFLSLIDAKKINNYSVFIYRWPAGSQWLAESERRRLEPELRRELLICDLSAHVITQYEHSHAGLLSRMKNVIWEQLQTYSGVSADKIDWSSLPKILDEIYAEIERLPNQLCLWSLSSRMILETSGGPKIANVARWAWEPVGATWPLKQLKQLDADLAEAAKVRLDLLDIDPERAKFVARMYEFERRYRNKNYAGAVNVLSNLLSHFDKYKKDKMSNKEKENA